MSPPVSIWTAPYPPTFLHHLLVAVKESHHSHAPRSAPGGDPTGRPHPHVASTSGPAPAAIAAAR
jgi:hypothetical protein